jgi:hypothetical protein
MPPEGIPITLSPVSLSIQRDLQEFRGIFAQNPDTRKPQRKQLWFPERGLKSGAFHSSLRQGPARPLGEHRFWSGADRDMPEGRGKTDDEKTGANLSRTG